MGSDRSPCSRSYPTILRGIGGAQPIHYAPPTQTNSDQPHKREQWNYTRNTGEILTSRCPQYQSVYSSEPESGKPVLPLHNQKGKQDRFQEICSTNGQITRLSSEIRTTPRHCCNLIRPESAKRPMTHLMEGGNGPGKPERKSQHKERQSNLELLVTHQNGTSSLFIFGSEGEFSSLGSTIR